MQNQKVPAIQHLILYLIDKELISGTRLRRFVILEEFKIAIAEKRFHNKTQTVEGLAHQYELHPNTVWGILKEAPEKSAR